MSSVISLRGVGYRYATRLKPAVKDVSLDVEAGEVVLLSGDSGSGKSTLLSIIAGIIGDDEDGYLTGEVNVAGITGMVLQDPDSQVISAKVGDDVAFGAENLNVPRDEIWPRVRKALELVELDVPLDQPTARLSGGQKQRLALAGVLAMGAEILLLDEPTANLDPQGRAAIVKAVGRIVAETGVSVIISEHRAHHWQALNPTLYALNSDGIRPLAALPDPPLVDRACGVELGSELLVACEAVQTRVGPPRSFILHEGTSTVMTGPNGSGKSTLAATIAGLFAPKSGEIVYAPSLRRGLSGPSYKWRSSDLAKRIGYVGQDPEHHFAYRTVAQELAGPRGSAEDVEQLLARLKLDHLREANPFTLSGGEKRRLSVGAALVEAPDLLILDEPTFGQDDSSFLELVALVRELTSRGVTVLSITHDELYLEALGDAQVQL